MRAESTARWRTTLSFMQAGAGLGLLLMALHGLTEYNWHIPSNAIYFALMAGVFFHRGEAEREPVPAPRARPEAVPAPVPVAHPPVKNPFAD